MRVNFNWNLCVTVDNVLRLWVKIAEVLSLPCNGVACFASESQLRSTCCLVTFAGWQLQSRITSESDMTDNYICVIMTKWTFQRLLVTFVSLRLDCDNNVFIMWRTEWRPVLNVSLPLIIPPRRAQHHNCYTIVSLYHLLHVSSWVDRIYKIATLTCK